ncbi:hypothetical protein ACIPR8_07145 [Stenotrophomonas sp. LARHCG68]
MADPISGFDAQRISVLGDDGEVEALPSVLPIDLSPPQGNTDPQTHVVVSLTG